MCRGSEQERRFGIAGFKDNRAHFLASFSSLWCLAMDLRGMCGQKCRLIVGQWQMRSFARLGQRGYRKEGC